MRCLSFVVGVRCSRLFSVLCMCVCRLSFSVCCLWIVVRCVWRGGRCVLFVGCWLSFVVYCSVDVGWLVLIACRRLCVC